MKIYLDTETVGLCGPVKLIQYAIEGDAVQFIPLPRGWETCAWTRGEVERLWDYLRNPKTLFIGFNTSFDLCHLYKTFHRWKGLPYDSQERPVNPFRCKVLDLQTHAIRNSPLSPFAFSKRGARSIAAVRRIPRVVAGVVRGAVESRLKPLLPSVCELKCSEHEVPGRKELVTLSWHTDTRLSLKNLMQVYGLPVLKLNEVWPLPPAGTEKPWLPYPTEIHEELEPLCDAILSDRTLPFWTYARLDIEYLRVLEQRLGNPQPDHHDTCTHAVAYTRYFGAPLDRSVLERTREAYRGKVAAAQEALAGVDLASPKQRLALLRQHDPLIASSSKKVIAALADSDRPSAPIARAMIDFGMFTQRLNQVEKCLESRTGRAHMDFRCMGTRTGRMAGSAGLNWQGICKAKKGIGIRAAVETAAVGDWHALEVILGANVYQDEAMFYDIEHGIDPHASTASLLPGAVSKGFTYEDILAGYKAGDPVKTALRAAGKPCNFLLQYFGAAPKLADTTGMSLAEAEKFVERFYQKYSGFGAYRKRMEKECITADTEHWSRESVSRMADSITDLTGYTIRWGFEKQVAMQLWALGGSGIRTGRDGTVTRTPEKGPQTYDGAVRSALLGGAIAIQNAVMRQRGNAAVQSLGSNLTKMLMARIWDKYRMPCYNVHDELVFVLHTNFNYAILQKEVDEFTTEWLQKLRFIRFDLKEAKTWSEK